MQNSKDLQVRNLPIVKKVADLRLNKGGLFLEKILVLRGGDLSRQFGVINRVDIINWPP